MINAHNRNLLCEYKLYWSKNVVWKDGKPQKLDKTAIISIRDLIDITKFQKP